MLACSGAELEDDSIMDISNEFMIENEEKVDAKIDDKHKNPDLMLKSVDRLTQELVSTAEYLRKNTNSDNNEKMSNSISNNTWNDEISFPSISMSAPMIGSTNDEATFATDQIQPIAEEVVDGNSDLNEKTPTNEEFKFKPIESDEKFKVDFKLGGEIYNATGVKSKIPFFSCGPASLDTCSTLSNSTIVDKKISRNNQMEGSTTSLMDLENVRPPSSMDSISLCSFNDLSIQQSPMRNSLHKKSLMSGKLPNKFEKKISLVGSVGLDDGHEIFICHSKVPSSNLKKFS
jgi:adenomatosis polyposis coli protein